ncbi:MAG: hypothetical protein M3239_03030 [Thermoproteota archaeon]|nr:hypothetical protein [Thermoproteota archaeon]
MTSDEEDDNEQLDNRNVGDDVGSLDKQAEDEEGQQHGQELANKPNQIVRVDERSTE